MPHHRRRAPGAGIREVVTRRRLSTTLAATTLIALTAAAAVPLRAASYRLSQGLPFSDVEVPRISPDGRYAVYVHDAVIDGAKELWSVPVAGGEPVRLSGPLPSGSSIASFQIASDSQRVVYNAPQDSAGVVELYSAPIAGPEGSWTKLSPPLVTGGDVDSLAISPDGGRVAFVADVQTVGVLDVWSVPTEGGTALRHRPAVTIVGSSVESLQLDISSDGERVLFLANFSTLAKRELWSARLDGTGGVTKLNGSLVEGGDVEFFRISPTSARAVYTADQELDGRLELYSVPIGGGASTKLNGALVSGGDVDLFFTISPDSSRVVYLADQQVDQRYELYSVPLAGGAAVKLNGALVSGGDVWYVYAISPDSSRVVYRADQHDDERYELFSVPIAGGAAVKIDGAVIFNADVSDDFSVSADSSLVVYTDDHDTDQVNELYSVPIAGGPTRKANDSLVTGGEVRSFLITLDSDFVVYRADKDVEGRFELFRGSILGGTTADDRVSGSMVANGAVDSDVTLHPDSLRVLYLADQEVDELWNLYIGDPCILCDGFEGGDSSRWE